MKAHPIDGAGLRPAYAIGGVLGSLASGIGFVVSGIEFSFIFILIYFFNFLFLISFLILFFISFRNIGNFNFFNFLFCVISHIEYYTIPLNINYYWNIGFILSLIIIIQILSGLLLSTLYCNYIIYSYYSIYYIIREILYGFIFRYIHSNGSSFIFGLIFIHYYRSIIFGSIIYIPLSFISGIIILLIIIIIGFIGYILPYGQMSFWGATVITSLLSFIPFLIEWVNGNYYISESSIKRLFILHYLLSFILLLFIFYHIFYLHYQLSNNSLGIINYLLFPFFPPPALDVLSTVDDNMLVAPPARSFTASSELITLKKFMVVV